MLYIQLKKALYGTLQVAFLLWQLLSKTLVECGFKQNNYDQCVENKNNRQNAVYDHLECR